MDRLRIGFQTWPEHADYQQLRDAWQRAEALGVDSLWLWDHFFPLNGDPDGKHLECWTLLAAMAEVTSRVQFGALVTCYAYRNANLLADIAQTVDQVSGGRLVLGIGSGWFRRDFDEYGFDYATDVERLRQLESSVQTIELRLGELNPGPFGDRIPLLIGGAGERITLRLVATYADIWNVIAEPPAELGRKAAVLDDWCRAVGRAPDQIERSVAIYEPEHLDWLDAYVGAGFTHFIYGAGGPAYDNGVLAELIRWRDERNRIAPADPPSR
jgi:probable F420-dependent oxidoreductase